MTTDYDLSCLCQKCLVVVMEFGDGRFQTIGLVGKKHIFFNHSKAAQREAVARENLVSKSVNLRTLQRVFKSDAWKHSGFPLKSVK